MPNLPLRLDREVERLWQQAQVVSNGALFNGRVFTADDLNARQMLGHWTEYRRVVAQMQCPELFDELRLRPCATGGLLTCPDGVLFGQRPRNAIYQPGLWQLPPAGSIDPSAAREDGTIDLLANIFMELSEEIGLDSAAIIRTKLLCLAEHPGSHVLDIGIALHTQMGEEALRETHAMSGNEEYASITIIPIDTLGCRITEIGSSLTPQALAFLAFAGLLPDSSTVQRD
jgi:8-oxo-dGTP pyrophosphatase MutT (NUDIX family)